MALVNAAEYIVPRLHKCMQCGHRWSPRKSFKHVIPQRCPGCNTRAWQSRGREMVECSNCQYRWKPRVAKPRACPHCYVRLSWA